MPRNPARRKSWRMRPKIHAASDIDRRRKITRMTQLRHWRPAAVLLMPVLSLSTYPFEPLRCHFVSLGAGNEAARVHHTGWRRGSGVAAGRACAAEGEAPAYRPVESPPGSLDFTKGCGSLVTLRVRTWLSSGATGNGIPSDSGKSRPIWFGSRLTSSS